MRHDRRIGVAILAMLGWLGSSGISLAEPRRDPRPNIVWIVTEDISPNLGCYADPDAITPNLDRLAAEGARFQRAFSHAPVCAPTRSGLITGVYPTTLGSHHMRSKLTTPPPLFTDDLKKAGYTVFWPGKTDFNFDVTKGWADTRNWVQNPRLLPQDRPFFAYINFTITHESQARPTPAQYAKNTERLTDAQRHNPANVRLPKYYPDHPLVRKNVAIYHDNITAMDHLVGDVLKVVDDPKWRDNTIVVFFGDHGWGLSRGKRWCYDSGLRVPLLVRWPGVVKPGSVREDLVQLLDLAPTMLSVAGVPVPQRMQGQVILGANTAPARTMLVGGRDRMDEAVDRIRTVRSQRYRYIRNFRPDLPYAQYINYMDEMPIMKVWREQAFAGKLNPIQAAFFARTKPKEEFYDLAADPEETVNLANSPELQAVIREHAAALDRWMAETKDMGEIPEQELIRRGIVRDLLNTEYAERVRNHPKTPPVP
ncbi:sulfatase family protein [Tuwongella immobilis]|nr:sulfatase [Tuwongella immobilis]